MSLIFDLKGSGMKMGCVVQHGATYVHMIMMELYSLTVSTAWSDIPMTRMMITDHDDNDLSSET